MPQTSSTRGRGTVAAIASSRTVTSDWATSRSAGLSRAYAPSGVATADTTRANRPGVAGVRSTAVTSRVTVPALAGASLGGPPYAGRSVEALVGRAGRGGAADADSDGSGAGPPSPRPPP